LLRYFSAPICCGLFPYFDLRGGDADLRAGVSDKLIFGDAMMFHEPLGAQDVKGVRGKSVMRRAKRHRVKVARAPAGAGAAAAVVDFGRPAGGHRQAKEAAKRALGSGHKAHEFGACHAGNRCICVCTQS